MRWLTFKDDRNLLKIFRGYDRNYDPVVMRMMRTAFCLGARKGARETLRFVGDKVSGEFISILLMNNDDDY